MSLVVVLHRPRVGRFAKAVAVVVALFVVGLQFQRPAAAGSWAFNHGWAGENILLGQNHERRGGVFGIWVNVLQTRYGYFVSGTDEWNNAVQWWTVAWQQDHGITADGIVGRETWAAARWWHLEMEETQGDFEYYRYGDLHSSFVVRRYAPFDVWQMLRGCDFTWVNIDHATNWSCW